MSFRPFAVNLLCFYGITALLWDVSMPRYLGVFALILIAMWSSLSPSAPARTRRTKGAKTHDANH